MYFLTGSLVSWYKVPALLRSRLESKFRDKFNFRCYRNERDKVLIIKRKTELKSLQKLI